MSRFGNPTIPLLSLFVTAALVLWAYPEGPLSARTFGILLGWTGCGLLLSSLGLMLREPRLARRLGGLENMYRWHHRTGMAAYVALLAHPLLLAADALPARPMEAWETLSPFSESWPVWSGWLSLAMLMAGLGITFMPRLAYRIRRPLHAALGVAVLVGLIHLFLLGIDEPVLPIFTVAAALFGWRLVREDWGLGAHPYVTTEVTRITDGVVEVALKPLGNPLDVGFGQFVLVAFGAGPHFRGCGEFHPFTVSALDDGGVIRIAVKALGDCTRHIQSIEPGVSTRVEGAFGSFLADRPRTPQLWIAGGIGLTPFLAALRGGQLVAPTTLIYLYRTEADAPFVSELRRLAASAPLLTLISIATGEAPPEPETLLSDDLGGDWECHLCGPPPMIDGFVRALRQRGVGIRRMHFESFESL